MMSLIGLMSQVVSSKQPKLWLKQELSVSRICESATGYTFTPCVGYFTSPGIDTRQKGPPAFSVSSERHRQMWGERNCLSFETAVGGVEPPSSRSTVRRDHRSPLGGVVACFWLSSDFPLIFAMLRHMNYN